MPNSTSRALATFIGAMLGILAILVAASLGGIASVNVIRGYASGGTYYAKGHLSAVAALRRYAATGSPEDLYRYREDIYAPYSDGVARELLEQTDIPIDNSYPFLVGGKNHPEDAPGIAILFRIFRTTPFFAPTVSVWREADREVRRIDELADALQRSWATRPGDSATRARLLSEIEATDARLLALEDRFAWQLGQAARYITRLLYAGLAGLAGLLVVLVLVLGYRTQRRLNLAERTIREREERFRDVADMAADWIWETDADLRFTYLSDRVEGVVGLPKESLLGKTRFDLVQKEGDASWRQHLDDLTARRPFRGFQYSLRLRSGKRRHFRLNGKPVFDADGRFAGYRGTGSDVTDEVEAQRAIADNSALLQTVFENMTQGISVAGPDLKMVAFNERFLELLDFPKQRFGIGTPFEDFIRYNAERGDYGEVDVDAYVAGAVAAARRFEPHLVERTRPNGTVLEIRGQPLPGGGFVTTYTDITELRRATRELQAAKVTAEAANHAKSAFLANMSHELRTPLNAVIGFADLMAEEKFGPLGDRYATYARDIRQSGQHLLAVINDILDITRIEAGRIELSITPIPPAGVVDGCFRMMRQRAVEAGITLRNEVPADAPPLHADVQRVRQIILNLVGNAIKFSPAGGSVEVRYVDTGNSHGLSVADHGIGMPAGQIDDAFQPFAQLHAGFGRKYEGAGLGLPLVRRFMELHGGSVTIASDVDAGTTATILFPKPVDTSGRAVSAAGGD
ncbi:hypothetical protein GCM10017083_35540 [Thalassobaculum fulvum]|uniref:histidine kinase n=1 Tax=Thalassobaculum fulvum TaxID=1633335 RepID=A0A918XU79_9PROT|nr:PAS-domain containing protein [Thalassobaculum fulvum]GHD55992.1 hypothetical protein GCM10017083_35540 [Thalassobaculum fulvum]